MFFNIKNIRSISKSRGFRTHASAVGFVTHDKAHLALPGRLSQLSLIRKQLPQYAARQGRTMGPINCSLVP
jgi:hypothetical protein